MVKRISGRDASVELSFASLFRTVLPFSLPPITLPTIHSINCTTHCLVVSISSRQGMGGVLQKLSKSFHACAKLQNSTVRRAWMKGVLLICSETQTASKSVVTLSVQGLVVQKVLDKGRSFAHVATT